MTFTSATRAAAVSYALRQVGHPYLEGAADPAAFDCSGLVRAAWQFGAGVTLPHNSTQQSDYHLNPYVKLASYTYANRVRLLPGDLVFYYPGITHVALYVRNAGLVKGRLIVQATNEQLGVQQITMEQYAKPVSLGFMGHS